MKKLILLMLLLSNSVFARSQNYECRVFGGFDVSLNLDTTSTHMYLIDRMQRQTIFQDYVKVIRSVGEETVFYFYPTDGSESTLSFKTSDIENYPKRLSGEIYFYLGMRFVTGEINCEIRN
jgi:hypothetical protein